MADRVGAVPAKDVHRVDIVARNGLCKLRKFERKGPTSVQHVSNETMQEGTVRTEYLRKRLHVVVAAAQMKRHACVLSDSLPKVLSRLLEQPSFEGSEQGQYVRVPFGFVELRLNLRFHFFEFIWKKFVDNRVLTKALDRQAA